MTKNDAVAAAKSRLVKRDDWTAPNGEVFSARVPTTMQMFVFFSAVEDSSPKEMLNSIQRFLRATFSPEDYERIWELIELGEIDLPDIMGSDDNDEVKSLLSQLSEAVSGGRPTRSSDGSSSTSGKPGKRSTGRSPGKGSTRSTSLPTDS